ncbi:MAG: hypothetical protein KKF22_01620 [Gammaproteobacteria bacterium]|nr:hypothetical protein [Gammaproteobacteria bacterium]
MKELTAKQVEEVSGGIGQVLAGIGYGMLGSYLYDSIGGYAGVNGALHNALRVGASYSQSIVSRGSRSGRARGALAP